MMSFCEAFNFFLAFLALFAVKMTESERMKVASQDFNEIVLASFVSIGAIPQAVIFLGFAQRH
jgi:hypothetical protein